MSKQVRTIAIDFDGVLHKYNGYQNGLVQGPIPGAKESVLRLLGEGNVVVVFTTRGYELVKNWLREHGFPDMHVTSEKQPFWVIIDDRAMRFDGSWDGMVEKIAAFEPYWITNRKKGATDD
jgi:hypothetical protein